MNTTSFFIHNANITDCEIAAQEAIIFFSKKKHKACASRLAIRSFIMDFFNGFRIKWTGAIVNKATSIAMAGIC